MSKRRRILVNRGMELNEKRLQGVEVDVHFRIEDEEFPAHKLIVGLKSPYLKVLVSPPPGFKETGSKIDLSSDISSQAFSVLLDYIYSGEIYLNEENIFEIIETASYLQINDHLMENAKEFLLDMISSVSDIKIFLQIWNIAERFSLSSLSDKLYKVLEHRLEDFLSQDIFSHIGLEELSRLLSNSSLCFRDEQQLWNTLVPLNHGEEDEEICKRFSDILAQYFRFNLISWESHYLTESAINRFQLESTSQSDDKSDLPSRTCHNCVYIFEYTKGQNSLQNIESFLEDKKFGPSFAYVSINKESPSLCILPSLTNGKSYHQHYGPHSQHNYSLLTSQSSLFILGGLTTHVSSKTVKSSALSSDLKTFEYSSGTWLRWRSSIPTPSVGFGCVFAAGKVYILGGLVEDSNSSSIKGVRYLNSKLGVSRKVYVAMEGDLTQMSNSCWEQLCDMPHERTDFATVHTQNRIYLIGNRFIDIYDVCNDSWSSITPINTFSKPVVGLIGSSIYILSGKSQLSSSNNFYALNTVTHTWKNLPKPQEIRFDVIDSFAHNNLFYVIVQQRSIQTAILIFDPEKETWTTLLKNIPGTVRPGVIIRTTWLNKMFFSMTKVIKMECH